MNFDKSYLKKCFVIGCDEVGRGPLAGPVVACAVRVDSITVLRKLTDLDITDSKKLSKAKRQRILDELGLETSKLKSKKIFTINEEVSFAIVEISPEEIDSINILQASLKAMKIASEKLFTSDEEGIILIDGNKTFESSMQTIPVTKGDSKSLIIGLASIIAKQFRDEKMKGFDTQYPGYFFSDHAGYPTAKHREAIAKKGISPIHRKSFKGVKEFLC